VLYDDLIAASAPSSPIAPPQVADVSFQPPSCFPTTTIKIKSLNSGPSNGHRLGGSRPRMGNVNRLQMAATTGLLMPVWRVRSCLPGNP
jgi:hypothetical protein